MASSKPNPRRSNGHRRDRVRRWLKAQALPCALCGQGIDYGLPRQRAARAPHLQRAQGQQDALELRE